jgi:spiro-SPASM protein
LTKNVLETHLKYKAEYTFAEGFCRGLTPAAVDVGALGIIAELAKKADSATPITADAFFSVIATDINSFEVETVIAGTDYRDYRLDFTCVDRRGLLVCERLGAAIAAGTDPADISADTICGIAVGTTPNLLRTVPAFYNVQVAGFAPTAPLYSPYISAPGFMPLDRFQKLAAEAAALSEDAVVSLSAWGEPLAHPDFCALVAATLAHKGLSVLIETWGHLVTPALVEQAAAIVAKTNGTVTWIVYIDAMDEATYRMVHRLESAAQNAPSLSSAQNALALLSAAFPGAVYPQFVRMNENEAQLEAFYRHYKEKGNVLIQKYDHYCGKLPDRKPADLSPLERRFCWHQMRDMVILLDGSVPLCKEDALETKGKLNIFDPASVDVCDSKLETTNVVGGIARIWEKLGALAHLDSLSICKDCDEYYTFNF